jgi:hypothetical protein
VVEAVVHGDEIACDDDQLLSLILAVVVAYLIRRQEALIDLT